MRAKLYSGYVKYTTDLSALLHSANYTQWVNGSFISTEINPRDIDLVNLIDYRLVDVHEEALQRFINRQGKKAYGVDGYIVKIYPEDHKYHVRTQSDLIYWESWFSKSRLNRRKQRFPKGFIELQF